ncbi:hypothetical protein MTO96_033341 [Rhipicephalus appendiculatus]
MRRRGSSPWSFVNKDDYMSDSGEEYVPPDAVVESPPPQAAPPQVVVVPVVQQVASRESPSRLADTASLHHLVFDDVVDVGGFAAVTHLAARRWRRAGQKGRRRRPLLRDGQHR